MPNTICVQADNASDNKCWTLLLFFAMLVHHGYTEEVFLSFLIVGHTHEDIDQLFSVLSRFLKRIGQVVDNLCRSCMQLWARAMLSISRL